MKLVEETIISGNRAIARSYAKINLTLDILGKMENGYHEIETVMQTVGLFDLVVVDIIDYGIRIKTNLGYLPVNENNIAYKAADAFFKRTGIKKGASILIHKNIPVAAGLAGGSSNAAAVLAAMNLLFSKPLNDDELLEVATGLGADVPFCLTGGTVLCKGIGEKMTKIKQFPKKHVLLVKPPINIQTAEIYGAIDNEPLPPHPKTEELISSLENGYNPEYMFNVMEMVVTKKYSVISGIKEKMMLNGAEVSMMSGSGSTVFGLFSDYNTAKASQDSFSHLYKDVYLTTIN